MGEQPSAAVRADTELFLELQGRDAVGVGRHQVGGPEPDGERQLAGVQDRPGRHRGLPAAAGALEGACFSAQPMVAIKIVEIAACRERRSIRWSCADPNHSKFCKRL